MPVSGTSTERGQPAGLTSLPAEAPPPPWMLLFLSAGLVAILIWLTLSLLNSSSVVAKWLFVAGVFFDVVALARLYFFYEERRRVTVAAVEQARSLLLGMDGEADVKGATEIKARLTAAGAYREALEVANMLLARRAGRSARVSPVDRRPDTSRDSSAEGTP